MTIGDGLTIAGLVIGLLGAMMGVAWKMLENKINRIDECKVDKAHYTPTIKAVDDKLTDLKVGQKDSREKDELLLEKVNRIEKHLASINGDLMRHRTGTARTQVTNPD